LAKYSAGNFITHGNSAASDTRGARIADINIDCFNLATSCVVKGTNSRTARFTNSTFVRGRGDVISASPTSRIFLCSIIGGNNGNGVVLSGDSTFLYNIVTGAGNGFAAVKCYNAHDVQIAHNHIWKDADTYSLLGNAVWISQGEANTLAGSINITENKFDTSYGAHVKITVSGNAALRGISIAGNTGFQNNAVPDDTYPFIEINVASGSSIRGLNIQNNMGHGSWASSSEGEYTYFIDNSASAGNIYGSNVGGNTIDNCGGMYNAFTPDHDSGNITIAAAGTTLTKSTTT
jgi:hypothetical protein